LGATSHDTEPSAEAVKALRGAIAANGAGKVMDAIRGANGSEWHRESKSAFRQLVSLMRHVDTNAALWRERGTEATVSAVAVQEAQAEQAARSKASREKTEALIARDEAQIRFSVAQRAIGLRWEARTQSWIPIEPKQEAGEF